MGFDFALSFGFFHLLFLLVFFLFKKICFSFFPIFLSWPNFHIVCIRLFLPLRWTTQHFAFFFLHPPPISLFWFNAMVHPNCKKCPNPSGTPPFALPLPLGPHPSPCSHGLPSSQRAPPQRHPGMGPND